MPVARGGASEQRTDCLDRLAIATDDSSHIRLPHRDAKHGRVAARALRDDDFVGELNQVAEDKLEELFHAVSVAGVYSLSSLPSARMRRG